MLVGCCCCCSHDIFCVFVACKKQHCMNSNILYVAPFTYEYIYMRNLSKIISLYVTSPSYILNNTTSSPGEALVEMLVDFIQLWGVNL